FALTIAVSTLLSAINSLTLSPALTALLLRREDVERETGRKADKEKKNWAGKREPLPRLAFVLLGGWLGFNGADLLVSVFPPHVVSLAPRLVVVLAPYLLALVAGALGWLLSRLPNRLLARLFHGFHAGLQSLPGIFARSVGLLLR